MAKYSRKSQSKVKRAMHEMKEGKLKSGRSGKKVKNPRQAIAIGLSEAREEGAKVPAKKGARKKSGEKIRSAKKQLHQKKSRPPGQKKRQTRQKIIVLQKSCPEEKRQEKKKLTFPGSPSEEYPCRRTG